MKLNNKRWMIAIMLFLVLTLISATVVEAGKVDDFKKSWQEKNPLGGKRVINYVVVFAILFILATVVFKDEKDNARKYVVWALAAIITVVIVLNFTTPDRYIWEADMIKWFFLDLSENPATFTFKPLVNAALVTMVLVLLKGWFLKGKFEDNNQTKIAVWVVVILIGVAMAHSVAYPEGAKDTTSPSIGYKDQYIWEKGWFRYLRYYMSGDKNCKVPETAPGLNSLNKDIENVKDPGELSLMKPATWQPVNRNRHKDGPRLFGMVDSQVERERDIQQKISSLEQDSLYCHYYEYDKDGKPKSTKYISGYGILRGNHLFVFIVGALLWMWVFMVMSNKTWKESKTMFVIISIWMAANLAHSGTSKDTIIKIAQFLSIMLLYMQFSQSMSKPMSAAMAYGFGNTIIQASFGAHAIAMPGGESMMNSWIIGFVFGFAFLGRKSKEEGVFRSMLNRMGDKKKRDIDSAIENGNYGRAGLASLIPGIFQPKWFQRWLTSAGKDDKLFSDSSKKTRKVLNQLKGADNRLNLDLGRAQRILDEINNDEDVINMLRANGVNEKIRLEELINLNDPKLVEAVKNNDLSSFHEHVGERLESRYHLALGEENSRSIAWTKVFERLRTYLDQIFRALVDKYDSIIELSDATRKSIEVDTHADEEESGALTDAESNSVSETVEPEIIETDETPTESTPGIDRTELLNTISEWDQEAMRSDDIGFEKQYDKMVNKLMNKGLGANSREILNKYGLTEDELKSIWKSTNSARSISNRTGVRETSTTSRPSAKPKDLLVGLIKGWSDKVIKAGDPKNNSAFVNLIDYLIKKDVGENLKDILRTYDISEDNLKDIWSESRAGKLWR